MQLTQQELFQVLINRFYTYQDSGYAVGSNEHKDFTETLKAFVEVFTKGNATIKPKEDPKPTNPYDLLLMQLAEATKRGDLDAVTVYSQAIQRV